MTHPPYALKRRKHVIIKTVYFDINTKSYKILVFLQETVFVSEKLLI